MERPEETNRPYQYSGSVSAMYSPEECIYVLNKLHTGLFMGIIPSFKKRFIEETGIPNYETDIRICIITVERKG